MASIADRVKSKVQEPTFTGRSTRSRAAGGKQQTSRKPQNPKRKRAVDDDDDEEEEDGNSSDNGNPKDKNQPPAKKRAKPRCKFCARDPIGKQMLQDRNCDYTKVWKENFIECQNCADYRSQNPGTQNKCQPPNVAKIWRQYGIDDPPNYMPPTCDQCLSSKLANQCNVDSTLGYACTTTKACREGRCTINGRQLEKPPRPRGNVVRWMRTECQVCENKTKKNTATTGCSWLGDRTTWNQACTYCQSHNLACLSGGHLIASPPRLTLPKTWAVNHKVFDWGFVECRAINPDRRNCKRCRLDGHDHCRADAGSYGHACNRCAQFGIDCVDNEDGTHYPIFDLARVGIGGFMPFVECSSCTQAGRNCDLQRPCDSCVKHGDNCDEWKGDTAKLCIRGRLDPPPGPLYYLALGYGAQGVDDPKDGSAIEHWVGPATNIYSMFREKQRKEVIATLGVHLRARLRPPGAPPHGDAAQGGLILGRASTITQRQIVTWIRTHWPEAYPMNQFDQYQGYVDEAQEQIRKIRAGEVVRGLPLQFWDEEDDDSGIDDDEDGDGDSNGVSDTPMSDANSYNEDRARLDAAGLAGARALALSALASPPAPAPAPTPSLIPAFYGGGSNAVASSPVPMDLDGNNPDWLMDFVYEDVIGDEVGALQFENPWLPSQGQLNFDVAAPSSQAMAGLEFSSFRVPAIDVNIDPNLYTTSLDQDIDLPLLLMPYIYSPADEAAPVDHNPLDQIPQTAAAPQLQGLGISNPPEAAIPALLGFVQAMAQESPFYNVLGSVPEYAKVLEEGNDWTCFERKGDGSCNNPLTLDSVCQCSTHQQDFVHVCNACSRSSAQELTTRDNNRFDLAQIDKMRQYLCYECAERVSRDMKELCKCLMVGAANVWGHCDNFPNPTNIPSRIETSLGSVFFRGDALPITGCACGGKLFCQRLCRNHRLEYGEKAMSQAQKMHEWRDRKFNPRVCPGCLDVRGPRIIGLSLNREWVLLDAEYTAWMCLVCGDWVVGQPRTGPVDIKRPKITDSSPQASNDGGGNGAENGVGNGAGNGGQDGGEDEGEDAAWEEFLATGGEGWF